MFFWSKFYFSRNDLNFNCFELSYFFFKHFEIEFCFYWQGVKIIEEVLKKEEDNKTESSGNDNKRDEKNNADSRDNSGTENPIFIETFG